MIKCKECGTELNENDKFCVYCGAKQENNKKEEDTEDNFEFNEIHKESSNDNEDKQKGFTLKISHDSIKKKFKLNREKLKIFGITVLTICVFAISLKLILSLSNKKTDKNTNKINSQVQSSQNVNSSSGEYILPYSNTRALTQVDIKRLNKNQLALARNEIFARHGYVFPYEPYKSYFASKSWYKQNPNYTNDMKELSTLERHNVKVILTAEGRGKYVSSGYDKGWK